MIIDEKKKKRKKNTSFRQLTNRNESATQRRRKQKTIQTFDNLNIDDKTAKTNNPIAEEDEAEEETKAQL